MFTFLFILYTVRGKLYLQLCILHYIFEFISSQEFLKTIWLTSSRFSTFCFMELIDVCSERLNYWCYKSFVFWSFQKYKKKHLRVIHSFIQTASYSHFASLMKTWIFLVKTKMPQIILKSLLLLLLFSTSIWINPQNIWCSVK